ncbi:MAG TPA: response regulator [Azospirillaceae bacterium]|nr:response regulator [Azospirillaceae bacterium]
MIKLLAGENVLACGRRSEGLETLRRLLTALGARPQTADDPASALTLAAAASASGAPFRLLAADGDGLHPGDLELYQRVCALFGAPGAGLLVAGGAGALPAEAARVMDPLDSAQWRAAAARVLDVPEAPAASTVHNSADSPVVDARQGVRILLAEDNEVNQLVAVGMLNSLGYQSEVVPNGAEAVAAVERGGFDLVLMDVRMPVMDGLEATRRIRALPPPLGDIPIVAVTANAMRGDEEACLGAGMNAYLAKPIRLTVLDAAVKHWLAHKK